MRTEKNKIAAVVVILFFLILVAFNSKTISNPLRIKLLEKASPSLKGYHAVIRAFQRVLPFAALREENAALKGRVELLKQKIEEYKFISNENNRLKDVLNFRKSVPFATIPAQVVGRDPSNWANSIIIDKGYNQGIRPNRAVLSTGGLVGRVLEVGTNSSKILLITDPNSKVGVMIHRNRQGGILAGRPDGKCRMIYIALDSDVTRGDRVITAGYGTIFPKNIVAGEVISVSKEPGRLYKNAIVRPAQDLSKLEEVLCIK